jgi:hypothetical protein
MKVTRLKKGYRINLSDSEMSVLTKVFGEGAGLGIVELFLEYDDADLWDWTPAEKAVIRKIPNVREDWFNITEDRRQ